MVLGVFEKPVEDDGCKIKYLLELFTTGLQLICTCFYYCKFQQNQKLTIMYNNSKTEKLQRKRQNFANILISY